jgi:hypothetical protein
VFFAPRDNPQIAGVVFLEHGMHGPNAASVARHVLDTFFAKKEGRPLPPPPAAADLRLDLSDRLGRTPAPPSGDDPPSTDEPPAPEPATTPIADNVRGSTTGVPQN